MELRILGRNAAIYAVGNVGMRAASLILIPLYAHLLTQADFGLLYTVLFTVRIMLVLMNVGTHESLTRFAAEAESAGGMGVLLGSSLLVAVLGGSVVTGGAVLVVTMLEGTAQGPGGFLNAGHAAEYVLFAAGIAMAQALAGQVTNYFRATNRAGSFMAAGVAVAALLVGANAILLYQLRLGIRGALVAQVVSYAVVFLAVSAAVLPRTGLRVSLAVLRKVIAFGAPLVVAESSWFLMTGSTVYFIGHYAGLEDVATYTLGYKLAFIVGIVLVLPLQLAFPPFVYSRLDSPDVKASVSRALTYYVFAFTVFSFGLLTISRFLVGLMAPEAYSSAGVALVFVLPAVGFYGLDNFGKTLLHVRRRSGITGTVALGAGLASLGLNFLLVPKWGIAGALVAVNASTGLAALGSLAAGLRLFPLRLELGRIALALVVYGGASVAFVLLRASEDLVFYPVMALGGLAALGILWIMLRPDERGAAREMASRLMPRARPVLGRPKPEGLDEGD